ncbi:MAG: hypothetical protein WA252_09025 [Candidatus Sulfotelmatobacter sp.]
MKVSKLRMTACICALLTAGTVFSQRAYAASATTGTLEVSFTVTIVSSIPTTDAIVCEVTATVDDTSGTYKEIASANATRSGSTATCVVIIPYSWTLTGTTDSIYQSYGLGWPGGASTVNVTAPLRTSSRPGPTIPVPASGTRTQETVDMTL